MDAGDAFSQVVTLIGAVGVAATATGVALHLKWEHDDRVQRRREAEDVRQGTPGPDGRIRVKERASQPKRRSAINRRVIIVAGTLSVVAIAILGLDRLLDPPDRLDGFDYDAQGWTVILDAEMEYRREGGHDGGYLSARDLQQIEKPWYWEAPEKYLGDQTAAMGKKLKFDLKQSTLANQYPANDVWLISRDGRELLYMLPDRPGMEWTSYSVPLSANGSWRLVESGAARTPSTEEMKEVLGNLAHLRIRGEYAGGPDTGGIDNVGID